MFTYAVICQDEYLINFHNKLYDYVTVQLPSEIFKKKILIQEYFYWINEFMSDIYQENDFKFF